MPRGMARKRGRDDSPGGFETRSNSAWFGQTRGDRLRDGGRGAVRRASDAAVAGWPAESPRLLFLLFALVYFLLVLAGPAEAGTPIASARVWPAQEYTRITLETQSPLKHSLFALDDPDRLVLDLEDVDVTAVLTG